MNYTASASLKQMFCHEFIQLFEAQNPGFSWPAVQADIFRMVKGVFEGATALPPPCGIGHSPQSGRLSPPPPPSFSTIWRRKPDKNAMFSILRI